MTAGHARCFPRTLEVGHGTCDVRIERRHPDWMLSTV